MNSTVIIVSCSMQGLKSLGSTFFFLKKERRGKRQMQDDLCEPASDSRTFRRAAWVTAPWGLSGLFHSRVLYVVIEYCVH